MKLLEVVELKKYYPVHRGVFGRSSGTLKAVDGVSFDIARGESLGIVGETGCGKTTLCRCVLHLVMPTSGSILFEGKDLSALSRRRMREIRKRIQMIFQDPFASFNPRMKVGSILEEPLIIHRAAGKAERLRRVTSLLQMVGLDPSIAGRYPHEFSGGQRQRIGIARALALEPDLIVADEPVSALDVSVQAQIINLLCDLRERLNLTFIWVAHDLNIVHHFSSRIGVMYLGKLVEVGSPDRLIHQPFHPYTKALTSAISDSNWPASKKREPLKGELPSPLNPPSGCRYRTRCPIAEERCVAEEPPLREMSPGESVACHLV